MTRVVYVQSYHTCIRATDFTAIDMTQEKHSTKAHAKNNQFDIFRISTEQEIKTAKQIQNGMHANWHMLMICLPKIKENGREKMVRWEIIVAFRLPLNRNVYFSWMYLLCVRTPWRTMIPSRLIREASKLKWIVNMATTKTLCAPKYSMRNRSMRFGYRLVCARVHVCE